MGQPPDAHFRGSVLVADGPHASSALFRREGIHLAPIRSGVPARNLWWRCCSEMRRCRLCLQRVQSHAGLLPCQFRYLLPFRVQVYRLAGFRVPSHVSRQQFSSQVSPFSPAGPIDLVPRLRRYYGDAAPSWIAHWSLMISPSGSPRFPHSFRALAPALPSDRRWSFRARGISLPASPIPAFPREQHRTSPVPC